MSFLSSVISFLLSVVLIAVFLYVCYYFLRRWFKKMNADLRRDSEEEDKRKRR
jgi:sugar phosphate permease